MKAKIISVNYQLYKNNDIAKSVYEDLKNIVIDVLHTNPLVLDKTYKAGGSEFMCSEFPYTSIIRYNDILDKFKSYSEEKNLKIYDFNTGYNNYVSSSLEINEHNFISYVCIDAEFTDELRNETILYNKYKIIEEYDYERKFKIFEKALFGLYYKPVKTDINIPIKKLIENHDTYCYNGYINDKGDVVLNWFNDRDIATEFVELLHKRDLDKKRNKNLQEWISLSNDDIRKIVNFFELYNKTNDYDFSYQLTYNKRGNIVTYTFNDKALRQANKSYNVYANLKNEIILPLQDRKSVV